MNSISCEKVAYNIFVFSIFCVFFFINALHFNQTANAYDVHLNAKTKKKNIKKIKKSGKIKKKQKNVCKNYLYFKNIVA